MPHRFPAWVVLRSAEFQSPAAHSALLSEGPRTPRVFACQVHAEDAQGCSSPPRPDLGLSLPQAGEPTLLKALFAKPPVETLGESVLRSSRLIRFLRRAGGHVSALALLRRVGPWASQVMDSHHGFTPVWSGFSVETTLNSHETAYDSPSHPTPVPFGIA
jgi:hypothetical protein